MIKIIWIFLVAVLIISPFMGVIDIHLSELFDSSSLSHKIFFSLRLPTVLLTFFTGITLALSGMVFQNIFKNSLMTPYTLGVSSGAVLGAGFAIVLGLSGVFGILAINFFGFLGAISTTLLLLFISKFLRREQKESLLLVGIALSFFYSSLLMIIYFLSTPMQTQSIIHFTMGSINVIEYTTPMIVAIVAVVLSVIIWFKRYELELLALSDQSAKIRGLEVEKLSLFLLILTSVAIGIAVSITGPIGFVGLIIPHLVRKLYKKSISNLIVPTALMGGLFLVLALTISKSINIGSEIPIGIVTALIGGPFFIYIIISKQR